MDFDSFSKSDSGYYYPPLEGTSTMGSDADSAFTDFFDLVAAGVYADTGSIYDCTATLTVPPSPFPPGPAASPDACGLPLLPAPDTLPAPPTVPFHYDSSDIKYINPSVLSPEAFFGPNSEHDTLPLPRSDFHCLRAQETNNTDYPTSHMGQSDFDENRQMGPASAPVLLPPSFPQVVYQAFPPPMVVPSQRPAIESGVDIRRQQGTSMTGPIRSRQAELPASRTRPRNSRQTAPGDAPSIPRRSVPTPAYIFCQQQKIRCGNRKKGEKSECCGPCERRKLQCQYSRSWDEEG